MTIAANFHARRYCLLFTFHCWRTSVTNSTFIAVIPRYVYGKLKVALICHLLLLHCLIVFGSDVKVSHRLPNCTRFVTRCKLCQDISKVQPTRCNVILICLFLYIALHVSGGSSAHHQEHKTVHTSTSSINKSILLPADIVDEMERSSISSTIAAGSTIGLTIPDPVCTVLCSWWWAEEPPETCRATPFHLIHDSSMQQYWFDSTWPCMYSFVLLMMGGGTAWNV
jgi:hypothetical protein